MSFQHFLDQFDDPARIQIDAERDAAPELREMFNRQPRNRRRGPDSPSISQLAPIGKCSSGASR
jgi:hypothetical protein